jgi:hypothetical protein
MKPTRDRRLQLIGLFAKRDIDLQFQRPIAYRGVQILSEEASEELAKMLVGSWRYDKKIARENAARKARQLC